MLLVAWTVFLVGPIEDYTMLAGVMIDEEPSDDTVSFECWYSERVPFVWWREACNNGAQSTNVLGRLSCFPSAASLQRLGPPNRKCIVRPRLGRRHRGRTSCFVYLKSYFLIVYSTCSYSYPTVVSILKKPRQYFSYAKTPFCIGLLYAKPPTMHFLFGLVERLQALDPHCF